MDAGAFWTSTVWPRAGVSVLSATPPSVREERPVQFTTSVAGSPLWWTEAAETMWLKVARVNVTLPAARQRETR